MSDIDFFCRAVAQNKQGEVMASTRDLAKICLMSHNAVYAHIKRLEGLGFIECKKLNQKTFAYIFLIDKFNKLFE